MENKIKLTSKLTANSTFSNFSKLNTTRFRKFGKSKARSELKLFPHLKRFLPQLTTEKYSSNFLHNTKSSQELQRTLSFNKNKVLRNKKDIRDLKIQYTKLQEENEINRKMISNILHLDDDILYSKEEILEKIRNCKIENEKKMVVDSINIINLKLELNEKKSILKSKNTEYNNLKENSKYKNYIEMQKQLSNNDDIKKEIIADLEKLKDILSQNKKVLDEKESEYKKLVEKYKKLKSKESNISEEKRKKKGRYIILKELTSKAEQKLQKKEIAFKQNSKLKFELMNSIEEKEDIIKEIKEYLGKREQINSKVQKRKEIIKDLEKKNNEVEKEFNKLNTENEEMSKKIELNENIYKKLDKKLKDDKKEKNSYIILENNLKKIKTDFNGIKSDQKIKIKKLKEIAQKNLENMNKNKIIIDKKKENINNLEKKKNEIQINIENLKKQLENLQNDINNKKGQIEMIKNNNNDIVIKDEKEIQNEKDKLMKADDEIKKDIKNNDKEQKFKSENENHLIETEKV